MYFNDVTTYFFANKNLSISPLSLSTQENTWTISDYSENINSEENGLRRRIVSRQAPVL